MPAAALLRAFLASPAIVEDTATGGVGLPDPQGLTDFSWLTSYNTLMTVCVHVLLQGMQAFVVCLSQVCAQDVQGHSNFTWYWDVEGQTMCAAAALEGS